MIAAFPQAMPVEGLLGGLLIGLSAAVMLLGNGRIAGVSGLSARALGIADTGAPRAMAAAFIVGLPIGAALVALLLGGVVTRYPTATWQIVVGGLLVGYGTRLGSGCTSGHGVCGMARLSPRSIAATLIFMASGIATVALMRAGDLL
ncbi:YeeE/YedE family protein [Sphingopyxis sp.]|uniref:YeeE/YedE family protein n=1 Tax=Sphingopyxis sp. TaxID=1908224 RepID=UPI0035B45ABB